MPPHGLRSIADPFLFALLLAVACVEGWTYWTKADAKAQPVEVQRTQNPPPYLFRTWPDTPDVNECSIGGGDPQLYLASVVVCAPRWKPPVAQVQPETAVEPAKTKTKTTIVKPPVDIKDTPPPVRKKHIERKQPREPPPKKRNKRDKGCGWQWC